MGRIFSYPKTATIEANTFFITDHPTNGTKAIDSGNLAAALFGGYKISVVDVLPPEEERDENTLYFVRKEDT